MSGNHSQLVYGDSAWDDLKDSCCVFFTGWKKVYYSIFLKKITNVFKVEKEALRHLATPVTGTEVAPKVR